MASYGTKCISPFVPKHGSPSEIDLKNLSEFVGGCKGALYVLTGAGISTESGIPDYRSEDVGVYARSKSRPIQHQDFMNSEKTRRRYWARNFLGWPRWSSILPNDSHRTLARWERLGKLSNGIVTQNVDQLHFKSGSSQVTELHGSNSIVTCMSCNHHMPRQRFQLILSDFNSELGVKLVSEGLMRPDGDVDLTSEEVDNFVVPPCPRCGDGIIKTSVVFFGDNVPKMRVNKVKSSLLNSERLLVLGSSLSVFSGYRIVLWAKEVGMKVAIVNIGPTRADKLADLKINSRVEDVKQKRNQIWITEIRRSFFALKMDQDVPLSAPPNTSHKKTFDWFRSWSSLSQDLLYPPQSATSSSTTNNNVSEEFPSSSISNLFTTWNPNEKIRKFKDRDPILIERSNLVNILKLVIKEVIDSSLLLEHVLRHGLRPKKGLLGPKKELWDILQLVEKHDIEAADITASVRDLPTVRTQIGRARAWLRLALMQKRLSDYFQILIDLNQNLIRDEDLSEFYDPQALLRSEEAIIVMGHLVSLNVVDCNLCVKEEDLDSQQGVIDFSLYLRSKKDYSPNEDDGVVVEDEGGLENYNGKKPEKNIRTNLEAKVESLTATNALMKEDLAISKNSLFCAEEENQKLLSTMGMTLLDSSNDEGNKNEMQISHVDISFDSKTYKEMEKRVQSEILQKENLQKKMDLQVRISEEMEMAMKLLEKDVHEKQDTIISLRDQLDDIKRINLEMYSKLQECKEEISQKGEAVAKLESKTQDMNRILEHLKN
ncbi:NAD-dependent protein deacylase SIR2rp2,NAD-dependent protein deacylase Sirt4,NAD-dependent protein deacylase SIR4,NAD-dependent protein deacetylase 2,NAD-dependent protein deacylase sir-2.2,NAD-dependent protein deacylase SRT2,NAD-dependent protein deacetylase,NAD-dependent protein deacylase sir-2.3,NAD-dependent protein deacetylase 3,Protein RUFY3,NAD-dependent protein deacetylase 1,NAD-dependent protein lipoamidase sirtuin-4, mitochondrial [Lepeophtheirus salmonis]|uniref:Deacetylase sirtuin-type domain-containing protein n=1 Tax=Lepeophtheirus salmonis TaxID=72036 RepID=A0A7R8CXG6_LEPSM|nr:NAD-dependent protein deacylase SIR2rp2,NAD-dependent protein deacylase Sirt4,NAD-dependent protein deacylase SIR4,NAD-dependent protein deacetylase 2,NAD-dependent protein deacylase sir-2.2,NAD-dependent protein deacylase SRT2,NAD-dependent protein deacetylase,NAD-dependent protein deacylase sir-2.3,NAD-dependent protein deacetylase 3,Protein RUFY3,NAD-dependent protein deacetylase 1,NAD-dependent protein lipoamidase sirtuin-4, mitochondrial [Lepeophtheirus salmonis]CAF2931083.1 NAD-dependent 